MYNIYSDYILQAASKIIKIHFEMDNMRQHIFNTHIYIYIYIIISFMRVY